VKIQVALKLFQLLKLGNLGWESHLICTRSFRAIKKNAAWIELLEGYIGKPYVKKR